MNARTAWISAWIAAVVLLCSPIGPPITASEPTTPENHLAGQTSPYLVQHARNPVDWYPWGDEAFAKAKAEGKPVFLSIGYSTCHWCHVMARESFEDAEIAAFLNQHFINIKVDREERPDVDQVYVSFVSAQIGRAGWPLSVFLTPERKPFVGGTYFPPDRFIAALRLVSQQWATSREALVAHGDEALAQLSIPAVEGMQAPETTALVDRAFAVLSRSFDQRDGGFGEAPKFPRPVALRFLARLGSREQAMSMFAATLGAMARGGIHDQLGGGFHRYAVDGAWRVPHFEKMLYDQGQLADAYLDAWQITGDDAYAAVVRDTLGYALRDLRLPGGGFAAAEDADSAIAGGAHGEGAFYVWTQAEIVACLSAALDEDGAQAARVACAVLGTDEAGNVPMAADTHGELRGKNVLRRGCDVAAAASAIGITPDAAQALFNRARTALLDARGRRPRPARDDKVVTAWNGLIIGALARASAALDEPTLLAAAQGAAGFLHEHAWDGERGLTRSICAGRASGTAVASDYALLISGLLDLHACDGDPAWITWALDLQTRLDHDFLDAASGTYFDVPSSSVLPVRMRSDDDQAEPAANSVAAMCLLRLARITDDQAFVAHAGKLLSSYRSTLARRPDAMPGMLSAMMSEASPGRHLLVVGDRGDPATTVLLALAQRRYLPDLACVVLADTPESAALRARYPALALPGSAATKGRPTAFFCTGTTCDAPTADPVVLARQLDVVSPRQQTATAK